MNMTRRSILRSAVGAAGAALLRRPLKAADAEELDGEAGKRRRPMRPHLLVTARKVKGLRSLDELRESVTVGHGRVLWHDLKERADADVRADPIAGGTRNFTVVNATITRVRQLCRGLAAW